MRPPWRSGPSAFGVSRLPGLGQSGSIGGPSMRSQLRLFGCSEFQVKADKAILVGRYLNLAGSG